MNRETQSKETLYSPSLSGFVMMDVAWSPDDAFIAFTEANVVDPAEIWGMGGFNQQALGEPYLVLASNGQNGRPASDALSFRSAGIFSGAGHRTAGRWCTCSGTKAATGMARGV